MALPLQFRARLLAPAIATALLAPLSLTEADAVTPVPGCAAFRSQSEAQRYFADYGGSPRDRVGDLDPDRDGVACEQLPAPYEGFATIGYNLKRGFFYGTVAMPAAVGAAAPGEQLACLYGNRHFPEGPRLLRIYRVEPGGDVAVTARFGAEAKPGGSRLVWKTEKRNLIRGQHYVSVEERVPISPYGANQCPGFRSAEVRLPAPRRRAG